VCAERQQGGLKRVRLFDQNMESRLKNMHFRIKVKSSPKRGALSLILSRRMSTFSGIIIQICLRSRYSLVINDRD
jgi:hypothetical protein